MSGIYIHIPFCKTRCTYCDFYSQTDYSRQKQLVQAMLGEIQLRKTYLVDEAETIYFGGGTPSTLSVSDIEIILNALSAEFSINKNAEITLEANPDDLTSEYLTALRNSGVNRLSMGIQCFDDTQLKAINRRHTALTALKSVEMAHQAGFSNISIDLIFGLPGQSIGSWKEQVDKAMTLDIQHLSAYGLTYEEGTPLWKQMKSGRIIPADDDTMIEMYHYLVKTCCENGFEQYEISNFARPGYRSRHNSSYWKGIPYLGIGPAAHSYNGDSRQWNISSTTGYITKIRENQPFFEKEILTVQDKYNDYVMVSLRTMEGINTDILRKEFGDYLHDNCLQWAEKYMLEGKIMRTDNCIRLTPEGIQIADKIIGDMMYV